MTQRIYGNNSIVIMKTEVSKAVEIFFFLCIFCLTKFSGSAQRFYRITIGSRRAKACLRNRSFSIFAMIAFFPVAFRHFEVCRPHYRFWFTRNWLRIYIRLLRRDSMDGGYDSGFLAITFQVNDFIREVRRFFNLGRDASDL